MSQTVLAAFTSVGEAENAITTLKAEGYDPKQMSVMMKDTRESQQVANNTGADVATEAASGATTGGVIGGIAGLLVGIGALTIPGIGPFLAAGPIAASLGLTGAAATTVTGAATGAVAGGLVGALMGLGLSHEDATVYEDVIKEGGVVVAVPALENAVTHVTQVVNDSGATQVRTLTTPR